MLTETLGTILSELLFGYTNPSNRKKGVYGAPFCCWILKCWAGKVWSSLKPQCRDYRRLGTPSKRLWHPSVGACGCSHASETCPETFLCITYDVLAQILEVKPSICSGFPTGKLCLQGKVLGRVCCKINEGKWRLNRNDKKK